MITSDTSYILRAALLYCVDDPRQLGEQAWRYHPDGALWIEQGHIQASGDASAVLAMAPADIPCEQLPGHLLVPGFIDTHVHYPQTEMIASYGEQLLSWLQTYTFPTEAKFSDSQYAQQVAEFFLDELLRNGTTTALVFCSVHPQSVDAFFSAAQQRQLRMIAGKVMMDRNAPADLCDDAEQSYQQSRELIQRWHGVERLQYAVTPRFAATSSPQQLARAGQLLQEFPDLYLHTHLAESPAEVAQVKQLHPQAAGYLDVYDQAGLLGRRSVFAHGIHLQDSERQRLAQTGSAVAHCPTSNLFLGSGLFPLDVMQNHDIRIGLGTDVGAGTSFSLLRTLDEAYKIQQLRGQRLDPMQGFYLATLGGARALDLDTRIGSLQTGYEADFCVLDLQATPLLKFRLAQSRSLQETLFALTTLGDDRVVARTYAMGKCVHRREVQHTS